ncbi:MAG: hypothetical protein M1358_02325 [Chloroflexi bacterium]|nr:hypothetical protein [Chloroflexota bacterium]
MEEFELTLFDYKDTLQWVRQLGWSDQDLRRVPVHEEATANEPYLNLADMGGTSLGVTSRGSGGGTSAHVRAIRNLYVYKREVPDNLWNVLAGIMERGGTSGYEDGIFGERGEAKDFPPR